MANIERRTSKRVNFNFPLRYRFKHQQKYGATLTRDIGEGGVKLILDNFVAPSTDFILELNLPYLSKMINAVGKVIWVERIPHSHRYEIGIKFLEINTESQRDIKDFVDFASRKK